MSGKELIYGILKMILKGNNNSLTVPVITILTAFATAFASSVIGNLVSSYFNNSVRKKQNAEKLFIDYISIYKELKLLIINWKYTAIARAQINKDVNSKEKIKDDEYFDKKNKEYIEFEKKVIIITIDIQATIVKLHQLSRLYKNRLNNKSKLEDKSIDKLVSLYNEIYIDIEAIELLLNEGAAATFNILDKIDNVEELLFSKEVRDISLEIEDFLLRLIE